MGEYGPALETRGRELLRYAHVITFSRSPQVFPRKVMNWQNFRIPWSACW
jgi:hypothetical protein